jgi:ribosomal protein L11 methyltransferase
MNYIEVKITITPNTQEHREIVVALIADLGYDSFEDTETGINAYIKKEDFVQADIELALNYIDKATIQTQMAINVIEGKNWNQEWENSFEPVFLNEDCVVRASFHKIDPKPEIDIIVDPKMAFGTGHHQTTYLASQELFEIKLAKKTVLDMGCGTAVLSILASKLGAKNIVAIDNDEDAYKSSLENIKINKTNNISIILGDAKNLTKLESFDIIIANINRNILVRDMDSYFNVLNPKGKIIFSGFYKTDLPIIIEKAESLKLKLSSFREKDNWVCAVFKK